jgi:hypothetical protein
MVLGILLMVGFFLPSISAIQAAERVNGPCRIAGQTVSVGGKDLACVKKGKKLRWKAMPQRKVPPVSKSPAPSSSPSSSPAPTPIPTPTRILTRAERWNALDANALIVAEPLLESAISAEHSVNFIWKISDKANPEVLDEIKRRYTVTAKFWEMHVKVTNPLLVLIGGMGEIEWLCREKLSWLGMTQPDCVEIEGKGDWSNGTAGQSQFGKRNVDMYTLDTVKRLDDVGWLARIQHEYIHNVFYELNPEYNSTMPCWMIESGAEYWGVVNASLNDPDRFIQLRNYQAQKQSNAMRGASEQSWFEFINRTDRTQFNRALNSDACGPVRNDIYSHAILANEFLVSKVGFKGYMALVKRAGTEGWARAVQETFSLSREELYREMATYMKKQFDLVLANPWAIERLSYYRR